MDKSKEYFDRVFDYLEYLEYPELVVEFNPTDVARSLARTIDASESIGLTYRMCALVIFSLTWNMQILPLIKESTKH